MKIRWPSLTFPPINLWNAPRQPALEGAMTDFIWPSDRARAENHELNRVCRELEDVMDDAEMDRKMCDVYRKENIKLRAECEALAAHIERLEDFIGTEDLGSEHMLHRLGQIVGDPPTTSLARRKAEWQAEALEALAEKLRWGHVVDAIEAAQRKGDKVGGRPGGFREIYHAIRDGKIPGVKLEGVVVRPNMHSHFDRPSWDVRVDRREGEKVSHGPLLCVTQQEIEETIG